MDKKKYNNFFEAFKEAIEQGDLLITEEDKEHFKETGEFLKIKDKLYYQNIQVVEDYTTFLNNIPNTEFEDIARNIAQHLLRGEYYEKGHEMRVVHNSKERKQDIHRTKEFLKIFNLENRKTRRSLRKPPEENEKFKQLVKELKEKANYFYEVIKDEENTLYAETPPKRKKHLREYLLTIAKKYNIPNYNREIKAFLKALD